MKIDGVGKVHSVNKVSNDFKNRTRKDFQDELRRGVKNKNGDNFKFSNAVNKKKKDEDLEK